MVRIMYKIRINFHLLYKHLHKDAILSNIQLKNNYAGNLLCEFNKTFHTAPCSKRIMLSFSVDFHFLPCNKAHDPISVQ